MLTSSRLWLIVGNIQALQRKVLAVTTPMIMITVSASSDACIDAFKRSMNNVCFKFAGMIVQTVFILVV